MPLTELDPNVSGRLSRASNISNTSRGTRRSTPVQSDMLSSGVMNMLRTSTELGDIGGVSGGVPGHNSFGKSSRVSQVPRPAHRRRSNHNSSRVSVGSTQTQNTSGIPSKHRSRPSSSSVPRKSITSSLNVPQFVPDTVSPTLMNIPGASPLVPPARISKEGRSFSLTNNYAPPHKLTAPRSFASLRHPDPIQRPRSPYRYPTRLRRPGYRSPSPAMSDVAGVPLHRYRGTSSISRTRTSPVSPMLPHEMAAMPFPTGHSRSAQNSVSPISPLTMSEMDQMPYQQLNRSTPAVAQYPYMAASDMPVPLRRPMGRNGSAPVLRPRVMRSVTSLTNGTDSDVPSSGTSMAPQTPRDSHSVDVMIQPVASPLIGTVPSASPTDFDPEQPLEYYDYSEQFESSQPKAPQLMGAEAAIVAPSGFVDHINDMLGQEADSRQSSQTGSVPHTPSPVPSPDIAELEGSPVPHPPAELPGSEVPSPIPRRITREMILSVIEPSSTANETTTMTIDVKVPMEMDSKLTSAVGSSPHPSQSPAPSESSADTMSTAQEQVAVASTADEHENQRPRSDSATTADGSNRELRVKVTMHSVPMTRDSVESTDSHSLREDAVEEPQVKLDIPESAGNTRPSSGKPVEQTPPMTKSSAGPLSSRAKSMFLTPKPPPVDTKALISAPNLGVHTPQTERLESPHVRVGTSVAPSAGSIESPIPETPAEKTTPIQQKQTDDEFCPVFETPAATPVTFTTDESTPGSATVQSTSTHSVPAKSYNSRESTNTTTHLVWPMRKSSLQSFEPNEEGSSRTPVTNNTIAQDLRLSTPRYPSQLSDVKEESCEESCSDLSKRPSTRVSSNRFSTNFKFPLPRLSDEDTSSFDTETRRASASLKFPLPRSSMASGRCASFDSIVITRASSVRVSNTSVFKSPKHGTLAESRLIPSMDFSHLDLFENLNDALGEQSSHCLDGASVDFGQPDGRSSEERPISLGPIREKYRSFFASLDDTNHHPDYRPKTPETVEMKQAEPQMDNPIIVEPPRSDTMSVTSKPSVMSRRRPFSPPGELITEVERLSVPSISGLTQRLSELIPSLKRFSSRESVASKAKDVEKIIEDPELKSDVQDIRHLGERPGLLNNVKSSRRLRALPGKTTLVVVDDDVYEELTQKEKPREEQPTVTGPRVEEIADSDSSAKSFKSARERKDSGTASPGPETRKPPAAELEAPLPAHMRPKQSRDSNGLGTLTRKSDDKPWGLGMKFPWSESTAGIDISFPAKAHVREGSPAESRPSRLRSHSSASSEYSSIAEGQTRNITAEQHTGATDSTTETHDTFKHSRKGSNRPCTSVMGDLTRKLGRSIGLDNSGYPTTSLSMDGPPHDPGDRYPTSALTPPSRFNIDDVRSFFSDDSSQTRRGGSFRKRLTQLKSKIGPPTTMSRAHSAVDAHIIDRAASASATAGESSNGSLTGSRVGAGGSVQTYEGATGMPASEFRTKRLLERIKSMWFRSGEFFKSWGTKKRNENQETREWLQDSTVNANSTAASPGT